MAARPQKRIQNALIETKLVSAAVTQYMPVTIDATLDTVANSTAGENAYGIALQAQATVGGAVQIALLTGGAIVPVQVGTAGATEGKYAEVGTTGLIDRTLGGGTTVRYIQGKFAQTGTSGDIVGLIVGQFAGGSS